MTRKRRMFDIEMPSEAEPAPQPSEVPRRGPMASAIAENAEALQARRSAVEAIRAENDALAHEFVALREAGHVVQAVPLEAVQVSLLTRERMGDEDPELDDLVTSIRELGLSNPIRVLARPEGGYELVQGFRRLTAYRRLLEETGQGDWARIPALIVPNAGGIDDLYRLMVDENVIRKDLSFAEMAHAAQNYAADPATSARDLTEAVATLFQSAAYSKRNYIRAFAHLLDEIGPELAFPAEIPRAIGVVLSRRIKTWPALAGLISAELAAKPGRSAEDELAILRHYAEAAEAQEAPVRTAPVKARPKTKTTFHIGSGAGQVKCTAGPGRLEIKVDRDFSLIDRARLEAAVAALIDGLA